MDKSTIIKSMKLSLINYQQLDLETILSTSSSQNLPALHILSNSSPPAAYSITIAR